MTHDRNGIDPGNDGLPPPPPAAPAGRDPEGRRIEFAATILLGLATVAIAFAAYQSALWGGVQDTALAESVRLSGKSEGLFQEATTLQTYDESLFVQFITAADAIDDTEEAIAAFLEPDEGLGDFYLASMTPQSENAVRNWFENDLELPFDAPEYWDALYEDATDVSVLSDMEFEDAARANKNSDKYVLVSTFLAAVLFFAGIATVLKSKSIRMVVLVGATTLLVGATIYLSTLDRTF